MINELGVTPHFPVIDKSARAGGTFSRADFALDGKNDRYICSCRKARVQSRRSYVMPCTRATTEERGSTGRATRREQKKVEMLIAHLNRILRFGRLRLRYTLGARDEFLLLSK